jgi:DNA-binding NtrC family response regulator/HAMP domain-containing protein
VDSERQLVLTLAATVAAVALLAALLLWRLVLAPVRRLAGAMDRVAAGDLGARVPADRRDELGALGGAWNEMTAQLATARDQLEQLNSTLEERVARKTAELQRTHEGLSRAEKMASLGKLAAVVAHEINNPLAGIRTFARLLQRRAASPPGTPEAAADETPRILEMIEQEAARCGEIVRNLLLFSRESAARFAVCELQPVLERCALLLRHQAEMLNVALERDVPADLPAVECDAAQLQQAVLALCMNALEATPPGGRVTLSARREPPDGGSGAQPDGVAVVVSDTGCGVPEEARAHVFEPFFSTKSEGKGVGLGLAVVYGIVSRHHGRVELLPPQGPGSVFVVHLPLRQPESAADAQLTIVIMTAYASVETAVRALKAGAYDYVVKPFDPDDLSLLVQRAREHRGLRAENQRLKASLEAALAPPPLVGRSPAMQHVLELIGSVAGVDATVLITGESGTGKELVARAIHAASPRRYNPLVVVNCGALPEGILESELFGHEAGAFTGARARHKGKFEAADGGTLFLDEIGDVSPKVQVELLRVLEDKRVTRLGGTQPVAVDFRVIAATNRDLRALVKEGAFREDLFWRLNVFAIELPPLRERPDDVPALAEHFLARLGEAMSRRDLRLAPDALEALRAYAWPGNVRELQNAIERGLVVARGEVLTARDLPLHVTSAPATVAHGSLAEAERAHVQAVLEAQGWNITRAARVLDVDRVTLYGKIRKYDLKRPEGGPGRPHTPQARTPPDADA